MEGGGCDFIECQEGFFCVDVGVGWHGVVSDGVGMWLQTV